MILYDNSYVKGVFEINVKNDDQLVQVAVVQRMIHRIKGSSEEEFGLIDSERQLMLLLKMCKWCSKTT